jgi:hypothetical protein
VLEVAVGDAIGVAVLDALAYLFEKLASFTLGESIDFFGAEVCEEVSPLDKFGNEVRFSTNIELFDQTSDMGTTLA